MKNRLKELLAESLRRAGQAGLLKTGQAVIEVEKPRQNDHGDLATNLALVLASEERKNPREIARIILDQMPGKHDFIANVEVAGPGFINFTLAPSVWRQVVERILTEGTAFGRSEMGQGTKVQIEFVSANPTGPLHVGHGRGAAVGDALANLLTAAGYEVQREYYINDAGRQMLILGSSVFVRYLQGLGRSVSAPQDFYQGDYIKDIAQEMIRIHGDSWADKDPAEAAGFFYPQAAKMILDGIRRDLDEFGVQYDEWFSEMSLHEGGRMENILGRLKEQDVAFEQDGALWYRTRDRGDEKDRVLVKSNGDLTYFASDVAYHADKFERGFDWVIDIWGADHHGYVPRMTAAVEGLSRGRMRFTAKLVQLVNLLRQGEPVAMSTRAGEFVTLREVMDEVGKDACRFIFLTRRSDSPLDFDLDLAKSQSLDNPVYYVQYAHARVASIKRKAEEAGLSVPAPGRAALDLLDQPEELELLKNLAGYPELVAGAAESLEPHRVTYYLTALAAAFHNYYNHHRVLSDDPELSLARLGLVEAVQRVVANGLAILGVNAPQRMEREPEQDC